MVARWLLAVFTLPGTMLILIPLGILWSSTRLGIAWSPAGFNSPFFWAALPFALLGGLFGLWTMALFLRFANGTPAPWDPPKNFIVRGPYRHVRNPMIVGVILMLTAESLFFQSWPLATWAGLFFLGNAVYFPLVEEPGLRRRFGDDYDVYCRHVRRWVPRIRPWGNTSSQQTAPCLRHRGKT
ncbi:MAG: methyltransferase family protein [Planctomycetaceae bacterium]